MDTVKIKERPIPFSAPEVRAILAGTKTQTRRIVKPMPGMQSEWLTTEGINRSPRLTLAEANGRLGAQMDHPKGGPLGWVACPHGAPGERLVVRESWRIHDWTEDGEPYIEYAADGAIRLCSVPEAETDRWADVWSTLSLPENFKIDGRAADRRWRPSIHMPRWAARITPDIVSVKVERLQEITEEDAIAEGFGGPYRIGAIAVLEISRVWDELNGKGAWAENPFVCALTFKRVEVPE